MGVYLLCQRNDNNQKQKTMTYEVTNQELFSKVNRLEIDNRGYEIAIELSNREVLIFSGEHGAHDYEETYGFILVS